MKATSKNMRPYFSPQTGITNVAYSGCLCATVDGIDPVVSKYELPYDLD